jgi:hypothetical protein
MSLLIIDPPSPFAALSAWRAHLARMQKLQRRYPKDATLTDAIRAAEEHLAAAQ